MGKHVRPWLELIGHTLMGSNVEKHVSFSVVCVCAWHALQLWLEPSTTHESSHS